MILYFDVDSRNFVSAPGYRDIISALSFKRGDNIALDVKFASGTTIIELASGATGKMGLKPLTDFDGDLVGGALSWVKTGTGTSTVYTFDLNLNTSELNTLLGVGAGEDIASVILNMEMEYIVSGQVTSSNTILATVQNDVIRAEDNTPTPLPGPDDWLDDRAVRYDTSQTLSPTQKTQAQENLGLGTAATKGVGTAEGNIPVLGAGGKLSETLLPEITPESIGAETPAGAAEQISAAESASAYKFSSEEITAAFAGTLIAEQERLRPSNAGTLYFVTNRNSASTHSVATTTGVVRSTRSDNGLEAQVGDPLYPNDQINVTIASQTGLSFCGFKVRGLLSVTNNGSVRSGNITALYLANMGIVALSGSPMTFSPTTFGDLNISNNPGLTKLPPWTLDGVSFVCQNNVALREIPASYFNGYVVDISGCNSLQALPSTGLFDSIYANGCTSLTSLPVWTQPVYYFEFSNCSGLTAAAVDAWYNAMAANWAANGNQYGMIVTQTGTTPDPTAASAAARTTLINDYGWIIVF